MKRSLLFFSLLMLLLSACQVKPPQELGQEWSSEEGQIKPAPNTNKAVLALVDRAHQASTRGDLATAESYLERGLRIEPRNPQLWHYLAKVNLFQGRHQQAISMAKRSLALASSQQQLQADNWRIIAHAYKVMGDPAAADQAMENARRLSD